MSPWGSAIRTTGRGVQPIELSLALVLVTNEEGGRVRPPLDGEDGARKVDRDVVARSGLHVPHRGSFERPQLAREREPLVSRDGGPGVGFQVRARVEQVATHRAGSCVEDTKREMQHVATFGVSDAHERSVRREAARLRIGTTDPGRERGCPEEPRPSLRVHEVDPVLAFDLDADRDPIGVERDPREPSLRELRHDRSGCATDRCADQPSPLVPGPVAPPCEAAVRQGPDPLVHADGLMAQLVPRFRSQVVGPHLGRTADRGDEGDEVGVPS